MQKKLHLTSRVCHFCRCQKFVSACLLVFSGLLKVSYSKRLLRNLKSLLKKGKTEGLRGTLLVRLSLSSKEADSEGGQVDVQLCKIHPKTRGFCFFAMGFSWFLRDSLDLDLPRMQREVSGMPFWSRPLERGRRLLAYS